MTEGGATLELRALTKTHAGAERPALAGLSLALAPGELVALVGPSGCGKSTTLRMVAGLDAPTSGAVVLAGRDITREPPQDRDVAMVFQGYALYPHMTARENVEFPLKMRREPKPERAARVLSVAKLLGLEKLLDRLPGELSGGERQRVAMARAIVRKPKVFLFDEPLSNLDAALRAELRVDLSALVRDLGTTSLYVTHDQAEAMTMADRVAVLRAGKLEQVAAPRELYEDPATLFVARFLGSPPTSALDLELDRDAGALVAKGARVTLTGAQAKLALPAKVTLGVRPEHVSLKDADAGASASIDGEVRLVEPLGGETLVHLTTDAGALVAKLPGFAPAARGDRVRASFDAGRAMLFDTATGARLRP